MTNILFNAIDNNDLDTIRKIKDEKLVNVNAVSEGGFTALGLAFSLQNDEAVKLLLDFEGIDVNQPTYFIDKDRGLNRARPLFISVMNDKPELLEALLEKNADPNLANHNKLTPLMYAFFMNRTECASRLLKKSNFGLKDKYGLTFIDYDIARQAAEKEGDQSLYEYEKTHQVPHPALIERCKKVLSQALQSHAQPNRAQARPISTETEKTKPHQHPGVTSHIAKKKPTNQTKGLTAKVKEQMKSLEEQLKSKDELIESLREEIERLKSLLAQEQTPSTSQNYRYKSNTNEYVVTTHETVEEAKREEQDYKQNQQSEHGFFDKTRIRFLLNNDDNNTPKSGVQQTF